MPRIEFPKFLIRRGRSSEGTSVLDKFAQIEKIATNASNIWLKGKDSPEDKRKRHWKKSMKT